MATSSDLDERTLSEIYLDTPTFPDFPALNRRASYGEGVLSATDTTTRRMLSRCFLSVLG